MNIAMKIRQAEVLSAINNTLGKCTGCSEHRLDIRTTWALVRDDDLLVGTLCNRCGPNRVETQADTLKKLGLRLAPWREVDRANGN